MEPEIVAINENIDKMVEDYLQEYIAKDPKLKLTFRLSFNEIVKEIIRNYLEDFHWYDTSENPLMLQSIKLIEQFGINPKDMVLKRDTSLIHYTNSLETIKYLIEEKGFDIDAKDDCKRTLLMKFANSNTEDILKYLIEKGADINAQDADGATALMFACEDGCLEIVKYLIEHGANMNLTDSNGDNCLVSALINSHTNGLVEYLIEKGAELPHNKGYTDKIIRKIVYTMAQKMESNKSIDIKTIKESLNNCLRIISKIESIFEKNDSEWSCEDSE